MTNDSCAVKDLIQALRNGTMSLEEVAERFRARTWPKTSAPRPTSYLEMAARAMEDPEPDVPDSYDEVVAAYSRGELSEEQFDALSMAVAEAKGLKRKEQ
jgi:hypothetical protein